MARTDPPSADVGIRGGQVFDGSYLVGLSVLGSRLSSQEPRPFVDGDRPTRRYHLHPCGHWQHWRWMVVFISHQKALDRQCQSQTCNAGLRCVGGADRVCVSRIGSVDCGSFDWAGRRGPSGLVRQFVYLGFRHVSAARGWIGRNAEGSRTKMSFKPLDLTGKVAVVIGGTLGIGWAIAEGLADAETDVIPTSRRPEHVEQTASAIESRGRRSLRVHSDVSDRQSLQHLLDRALAAFGK